MTTVNLSVWFDGIEKPVDDAIVEVPNTLQEEFNGVCKERIKAVLKVIGAKNVRVAFIAY